MGKKLNISGLNYNLRLANEDDADFVIKLRTEDKNRNQFINPISKDTNLQKEWIFRSLNSSHDYYFIIENLMTGKKEGTISIYNIKNNSAEWGRWVLLNGSLAAIESVNLIMKVAFDCLGLEELYSRTIINNKSVINFHNKIGQLQRGIIKDSITLHGITYDCFEHFTTKSHFINKMQPKLIIRIEMIFNRSLKIILGDFNFHHIGFATSDINKELEVFKFLGYAKEGDEFTDPIQGIKGQFITHKNQPRIELLENIEGSNVLSKWLDSGIKMYHLAYKVPDLNKAVSFFKSKRSFLISPPKYSIFFDDLVCFLVLPNRLLIELIQSKFIK